MGALVLTVAAILLSMPADEVPDPDEMRRHALNRLEILDAFVTAVDGREQLMQIVASCANADQARRVVMEPFGLNEVQATAALDLQVRRFAGQERQRIVDERESLRREAGLP
jgi:DNA gyrase/topoisomerase IV subunit A